MSAAMKAEVQRFTVLRATNGVRDGARDESGTVSETSLAPCQERV